MGSFTIRNPFDSSIPFRLGKMLINITIETIAGRNQKEGGSFNWKGNDKNAPPVTTEGPWFSDFVKKIEQIVPTHGNFAGPGYANGKRGDSSNKDILVGQPAQVKDPKTGKERSDYIDILAQAHDSAYSVANGQPDYWQKVKIADQNLVDGVEKLLDGTSPLYANGGTMTREERAYGKALVDGFKLKQSWVNDPLAFMEKVKNMGLDNKEINSFVNSVTQGMQFYNPHDFLRKLNLSENEVEEIEKRYAAYCEENGVDSEAVLRADTAMPGADAIVAYASPHSDDNYEDEDQDYYYGPGMGMG